jgi:hypothetical protein
MKKIALIVALTLCAPMAHAAATTETKEFDIWAWFVSLFESDNAAVADSQVIEASLANIDTALGLGPR